MVLAAPGLRSWQASAEDVTHLPFGASTRQSGGSMSGRSRWSSSSNLGRRSGGQANNIYSNNSGASLDKSKDYEYSSSSSLESSRTRSREQSSSREHLLSGSDGNEGIGAKTENLHSWRSKFAAESRNQQSPTISIIQIKLGGDNEITQSLRTHAAEQGAEDLTTSSSNNSSNASIRREHSRRPQNNGFSSHPSAPSEGQHERKITLDNNKSGSQETFLATKSLQKIRGKPTVNPKEIEKLTVDVNVQKKRQKFEGQPGDNSNGKKHLAPEPPPRRKSVKQSWDSIREKHCPVTERIVKEGNGESLRNSILVGDDKLSFRNLKFKKATHVTVGGEEIKLKEVTSTKAFEDRATAILTEMRKQRRTLQLEYVAKVSVPASKKISGWRDKLNRSDSLKAKEDVKDEGVAEPPATGAGFQAGVKRNSITQLASKIKRKLSIGKADVGKAEESHSWRSKMDASSDNSTAKPGAEPPPVKVINPLDFILMKEDFLRKNPPPLKKTFRKDRSVESDCGETSMASVMDSLKKIVKAINPRREFPSDVARRAREDKSKAEAVEAEKTRLREEILAKSRPNTWASGYTSSWEVRMRKYQMGANMPVHNKYASRWNSMQDLRIEPDNKVYDKKAMRERIQNKVLSSVHQAINNRIEEIFLDCDIIDFSVKGYRKVRPLNYKPARMTFQQEVVLVLECVEYRKRELTDIIAHFSKDGEQKKKKTYHVKPVLHGTEMTGDRFSYALINRTNAAWETVKPFNVAVRKKTELFDTPQKTYLPGRAKVTMEPARMVVLTMSPGTCGTTAYCEQHKWDNMKACALFSIVGAAVTALPMAAEAKRMVINLPTEGSLGEEEGREHIFISCERKAQSDLIQVIGVTGSLCNLQSIPCALSRFTSLLLLNQ